MASDRNKHNDSDRSLLHSEAVNIFSVLFASTFVHKTVSSTDNKRQQQNDLNDKTFTFIQFVSSRSTRSAKNWSRQVQPLPGSQVINQTKT